MYELLVLGAAVGLGNLVKGALGFGSAIVALPIAGLVLPPAEAIAVVAAVDVSSGALLVWRAREDIPWRHVALALVAALPAQWAGTGLQAWLPEAVVQAVVGVAVLALAVWMVWREERGAAPVGQVEAVRPGPLAVAAAQGGLLSGLVGMPGPPLVAWAQAHLEPRAARGFQLGMFLPGSLALIAMLVGRGSVPLDRVTGALGWIPVAFACAWLGSVAGVRLGRRTFVHAGAAVVAVAALLLLGKSFAG